MSAALILGTVLSTWQAARASRAEQQALKRSVAAAMAEHEAAAKRQEADAAREKLRRSLYISNIKLAQSAWAAGNAGTMLDRLDGQRPGIGEADLRGFEWHYLRRLGSRLHREPFAQDSRGGGAAVSPDGTRFVARTRPASPEGAKPGGSAELRLIDVQTQKTRRTLGNLSGEIYRWPLVFSPDGNRFVHQEYVLDAAGKRVWHVQVWDFETGKELLTLSGLPLDPMAKALDRSAELLALGCNRPGAAGECELKVWEVSSSKELFCISIPERQISGFQALAFSPDRSHLAGILNSTRRGRGRASGEVRIWEARTGKEVLKFPVGLGSMGLAFSPDGTFLALARERGAAHEIRETRTGREVLELTGVSDEDVLPMISFSPDGSRLAALTLSGRLRIWDLTDPGIHVIRAPVFSAGGSGRLLEHPVWSTDGRSVSAFSASGGSIATWQVAPDAERIVLEGPVWVGLSSPAAAASASRFAAMFEVSNGKLEVNAWDTTGKVVFKVDIDISPRSLNDASLRLSADGSRLAALSWETDRRDPKRSQGRWLRVWDLATGRELFRRDDEGLMHTSDPVLSPDGRFLVLTAAGDNGAGPKNGARESTLSLWDLSTGQRALTFELPEAGDHTGMSRLAFSPDGRFLAGTKPGGLRVWDTSTGKTILNRKSLNQYGGYPAYSADGRLLAVDTREGIEVVDASSGEWIRLLGNTGARARRSFSAPTADGSPHQPGTRPRATRSRSGTFRQARKS